MEALLFMLNSIAVVVMVFMGLRDDRRGPRRQTSPFRPLDDATVSERDAASRREAPGSARR